MDDGRYLAVGKITDNINIKISYLQWYGTINDGVPLESSRLTPLDNAYEMKMNNTTVATLQPTEFKERLKCVHQEERLAKLQGTRDMVFLQN